MQQVVRLAAFFLYNNKTPTPVFHVGITGVGILTLNSLVSRAPSLTGRGGEGLLIKAVLPPQA